MSKTKKEKLTPPILATREGMEAAIADYTRLKLKHVGLTAEMESEKTAVEKRYQERITAVCQDIELKFAAVQNYCMLHRSELFPELKSFETLSSTVRFYDTPPRVEKRGGKETFGSLAKRLLGLVFNLTDSAGKPLLGEDGKQRTLECSQYVRESDPELDKNALLADRTKFTPDQLQAMGIKFESDEIFAIEPKSELAQGDKTANPEPMKEAA